jgi:hypothetical protein
MKNKDFFKLNMNKETKRAVMVLSIIALLILIIGLVSCSMQLSQKDNITLSKEALWKDF